MVQPNTLTSSVCCDKLVGLFLDSTSTILFIAFVIVIVVLPFLTSHFLYSQIVWISLTLQWEKHLVVPWVRGGSVVVSFFKLKEIFSEFDRFI